MCRVECFWLDDPAECGDVITSTALDGLLDTCLEVSYRTEIPLLFLLDSGFDFMTKLFNFGFKLKVSHFTVAAE